MDCIGAGEHGEKCDVLCNLVKPIKLGYCAVKNRNAADIKNGMSLRDARDEERRFFETHGHFSTLKKSLFGIQNLTEKLVGVLADRIRSELPSMVEEVNNSLGETKRALRELGTRPPGSDVERRTLHIELMTKVSRAFEHASKNKYNHKALPGKAPEIMLWTRVFESFENFQSRINDHLDIDNDQKREELKANFENVVAESCLAFPQQTCFMPKSANWSETGPISQRLSVRMLFNPAMPPLTGFVVYY